jgi:outer membrane lipoprotein-sorting protein
MLTNGTNLSRSGRRSQAQDEAFLLPHKSVSIGVDSWFSPAWIRINSVFRMKPERRIYPSERRPKRNLRRAVLIGACALLSFCGVPLISRGSENPLVERWFAAQTNLQSWTADFVQTRSLKVLTQPLKGAGHVWVTAGGQFRWEMREPAPTIALRLPDQLLIMYPRLKRAEKYPLAGVPPGPLKDALALLDASVPRDRATMEEKFRLLSATVTNSTLQMALQPKSVSARKFIAQILIGFRTNDFMIASTEMHFADGSMLRNDFTNVVPNQPIDPAMFEPKLPPDFTVVEPLHH